MLSRFCILLVISIGFLASALVTAAENSTTQYRTRSGIRTWVDPATPATRQKYISSRGRTWDLTMSDEFNIPGRSFRPGKDHIWTSIEKPEGVNGAKQIYSHNMTSTACDDDGTCYFYIKVIDNVQPIRVFSMYTNPPQYISVEFQYRAAMVQSWNKFCFQGGMLEVRAQLPGAVSDKSGNPDLLKGPSGRVAHKEYYPTWPGIWMMGNLGRAIFSASTNRMWPFSYNRCEPEVFDPSNQRVSACDSNPGYGLNPNQGRGAPEIDVIEGLGTMISSSVQLGPGMPDSFRRFYPDDSIDSRGCIYPSSCKTPGANFPDIPTAFYASKRGHKSWYQGLRYQANPFCAADPSLRQSYESIAAKVKSGITENNCTTTNCPASHDANGDLGLVDGQGEVHWGINYNGTCFPSLNPYLGDYLCDPDNQRSKCLSPRKDSTPKSNTMKPFNYQMDAISSNWPVHVGVYTDYLVYQVEWVTGKNGYVRWNLDGYPLFEVPSKSIEDVPQDPSNSNPTKIMLEEPMYLIMNVAVSTTWGVTPPNPGKPCRGSGNDSVANAICDSFPMYMKIDYIRLYQDLGTDLDPDNYMQIGCDPASHPTKQWIDAHIDDYTDDQNKAIDVAGGAFCTRDEDCTIRATGDLQFARLATGKCVKKRCVCSNGKAWGGPRCTVALDGNSLDETAHKLKGYGPPFGLALGVAGVVTVLSVISMWWGRKNQREILAQAKIIAARREALEAALQASAELNARPPTLNHRKAPLNYRQNFV